MNKQDLVEQAIRAAAPSIELGIERPNGVRDTREDAKLTLRRPDGQSTVFTVQVNNSVDRLASLRLYKEQTRYLSHPLLLIAPYISQTLAKECRELGLNFIDTAGNVHIDVPGCLVYVSGHSRPKDTAKAMGHSVLGTTNGLRILFALLTQPHLLGQTQRAIAASAGVALGSVGKTLKDLEQLGHLTTGKLGHHRLLGSDELMGQWASHYPVALRHKLKPQRYRPASGREWQEIQLLPSQAVWGAEMAAYRIDKYIKPTEATIYSWAPRTPFIVHNRLQPDPNGPVEILDAFWPYTHDRDDALTAPSLLVYSDLMASRDGRNREVATRIWERWLHV